MSETNRPITTDYQWLRSGDGDWPPNDLAGTVRWFQRKLEAIPAEFRAQARCEIEEDDIFGGVKITISYDRPMTDEEIAKREAQRLATARDERARELRALAALKAKYEPVDPPEEPQAPYAGPGEGE